MPTFEMNDGLLQNISELIDSFQQTAETKYALINPELLNNSPHQWQRLLINQLIFVRSLMVNIINHCFPAKKLIQLWYISFLSEERNMIIGQFQWINLDLFLKSESINKWNKINDKKQSMIILLCFIMRNIDRESKRYVI